MNRKNKTPIQQLHGRNSYLEGSELYQVDSQDSESFTSKQKQGRFSNISNFESTEQPTSINSNSKNQVVQVSKFLEK
jgi:hypothetical protein